MSADSPTASATARVPNKHTWPARLASAPALVLYLAAVKLLLYALAAGRYGYFRDELYYLACAEHLDWGYVDQPPLIALAAWFSRHVFGESLHALRLLPALAGAGEIVLAGAIARQLGGRRFAQALAALGVLAATIDLGLGNLLTMNAFEPLFWMGCAYVLILMIKRQDPRLWVAFGVLAGLGLENKYSMAIFGFGALLGLLLTPERKLLVSKWLWMGGAIAFLLWMPNLLWNIHYHWPFLELMRNIRVSGRDIQLGAVDFILQQILMMNPVTCPLWLVGLLFLFFSRQGKPFRVLGWAYLATLVVFIVLKGKIYYPAPAYPMLLAAGAVAAENAMDRRGAAWPKPAIVAMLLAGGAALAPVMLPILPVELYLRYQASLPFKVPATEKSHLGAALPQWYADQFGWQEMTTTVARIYDSLPPAEREKTAIFGDNYGEAAAIDFFGPKLGLPKAISGHQNYFLWGPRNYTGEVVIVLGGRAKDLRRVFNQVEVAAQLNHPYALWFENRPIFLCRGLKGNLQDLWPKVKNWD
jgi:hypothetical protein